MSELSDDFSQVLIRHLNANVLEFEAKVEQIGRYAHVPLSVQFKSHDGYQRPESTSMGPYLFVGFGPETLPDECVEQGWKVEQNEIIYKECDRKGYFTVLFNHREQEYSPYETNGVYNPQNFAWVADRRRVDKGDNLPLEFYSPEYEIYNGVHSIAPYACSIYGVAIGVRFSKCSFVQVSWGLGNNGPESS